MKKFLDPSDGAGSLNIIDKTGPVTQEEKKRKKKEKKSQKKRRAKQNQKSEVGSHDPVVKRRQLGPSEYARGGSVKLNIKL